MKWYVFSLFFLLTIGAKASEQDTLSTTTTETTVISTTDTVSAPKTIYERHNCQYRDFWFKLIPNQVTVQYAGSIGVASLGFGWHYGKHLNWETDMMLGFVPKYNSEETKVTFTVKERYIPWHLNISSRWSVEPLTTGLFFNSIFGEGFWSKEPSRYPDRYYGFSTRVRANIFLGQRLTYRIPSKKRHFFRSISAYYEFSSCDMYIISSITNKNVKFGDILSFAAGLKLNIM